MDNLLRQNVDECLQIRKELIAGTITPKEAYERLKPIKARTKMVQMQLRLLKLAKKLS